MASDNNYIQHTYAENHPSLAIQMENAMEIVKKDNRLAEFAPQLRANLNNLRNGIILHDLTPQERIEAETRKINDMKRMHAYLLKIGVPQEGIDRCAADIAKEKERFISLRTQHETDLITATEQLKAEGFTAKTVEHLPAPPVEIIMQEVRTSIPAYHDEATPSTTHTPEKILQTEAPTSPIIDKIHEPNPGTLPPPENLANTAKNTAGSERHGMAEKIGKMSTGKKWVIGGAITAAVAAGGWVLNEHNRKKELQANQNVKQ